MHKDIVVIGAGPAGLSFARSLADTGLDVLVVEKLSTEILSDPPVDGRDIALTHFSKTILQDLAVWQQMPAEEIFPIREARVLDGKSPYELRFDLEDVNSDELGYLVSNHLIRKALYEQVKTLENVSLMTELSVTSVHTDRSGAEVTLSSGATIKAALVVAADSRFSEIRRQMGISASMFDFGRVAIVCRMKHEKSNQAIASECFHYGQTMAVLPLGEQQSSIVITVASHKADRLMTMTEQDFNKDVAQQLGSKLGAMEITGERYSYPLVGVWANQFVGTRFALIGDAAVGMHPVTAHGFNLGLRGQNTLATLIKQSAAAGRDIGSTNVLKRYQMKHRLTARPIYSGTNAIVKLFTNDLPLHRLLRKTVLRVGNTVTPIKKSIKRQLTEIRR